MKRVLSALLILGLSSISAQADNILTISPVGAVAGGATVGTPDIDVTGLTSQTLYIWVTDDLAVNRGLALDIAVTGPAGKIALTSAVTYNPAITVGGFPFSTRWSSVSDFSGSDNHITPGLIFELNATTSTDSTGINSANNGSPFLDAGYDVPAGLFLYGQFTFDIVDASSSWSTTISLQPSDLDIANAGNDSLNSAFTFGSATISYTAAPEPATLALLALGGLTLIRRRGRIA